MEVYNTSPQLTLPKTNIYFEKLIFKMIFLFQRWDMGVSLNGGTPISHPKMITFSRKTHGFVGEKPTILGLTPIYSCIKTYHSHPFNYGGVKTLLFAACS